MAATRNQCFERLTIEFSEASFLVPTMPGRARHSVRAVGGCRDSLVEEQRTGHLPRLSAKGGPKTQSVEKQRHVPLLRQNIPR